MSRFWLAVAFGLMTTLAQAAKQATTIDWLDLLPPEDRAAMENIGEEMEKLNAEQLASGEDRITQETKLPSVMTSTAVRQELDGDYVRIPGFLVPLELNERGEAISFFLVPYFGACIHVPPPPPNQIIYITFPDGIPSDAIYDPYWVTGTLKVEEVVNDVAHSTYSIDAEHIVLWEEE